MLIRTSFFYAKNWTIGSIKSTMRFFLQHHVTSVVPKETKTFPSPAIIVIFQTNYAVKSYDKERDPHMYMYVRSEVASLFHICLNIPLLDRVTKLYITSLPIVGIHSTYFKTKYLTWLPSEHYIYYVFL